MTTVTDPRLLRHLLHFLARGWDEYGEAARTVALNDAAHESLSEQEVADAWDSYRGHLALQDGINGIPGATEAHWSDINHELTGPDRTEQARIEIAERVAADEDLLLWGKR